MKNIGFDLVLPGQEDVENAPLQPQKSGRSRKTPQPELPPQRSSRRTPNPEKLQPQLTSRRDPAAGIPKKRGRPAAKAVAREKELENSLGFEATKDAGEGISAQKRKLNKAGEDRETVGAPTASIAQDEDGGTMESAANAVSATGVKKRKKRKSIGQQSISRAKSAKTRTPVSPAHPYRKKAQLDLTPKLTSDETSDDERNKEPTVKAVPLDGEDQTGNLEEIAKPDLGIDNVEANPGLSQKEGVRKPRKRKRAPFGQQPKKRSKPNPTQRTRKAKAHESLDSADLAPEVAGSLDKNAAAVTDPTDAMIEGQNVVVESPEREAQQKPNREKRQLIGQQKPPKRFEDLGESLDIPAESTISRPEEHGHALDNAGQRTQLKPKGKKRKSIGQHKSHRKSENLTIPTIPAKVPFEGLQTIPKSAPESNHKNIAASSLLKARIQDQSNQAVNEARLDASASKEIEPEIVPSKRKRGRGRKVDAAQSRTPPPITDTLASRKSKAKYKSTAAAPKARKPPKDSIPITFYASPSPVSAAIDSEDDPLSTHQAFPSTKTINAVDVLAQVCSEIITRSSSTLETHAESELDKSRKAELKRRKKTVDTYGEELAARLLQLTRTLNINIALTTRSKAAAKEERALRKGIKKLKEEREEVGVRTEELMNEKKNCELEELLNGISGAVKRGWEMEKARAGGKQAADMDVEV